MYYLCFDENKSLSYASAGRFVSQNCAAHPDRVLDSAVLLLGYGGECPISQDGREFVLKRGTFAILFPNVRHCGTGEVSKGQSHFWCHFYLPEGYFIAQANNVEELLQKGMCVIPEFCAINDPEKYYILFSQLIDESEQNGERRAITDSYIKILMCSLAESAKRTEKGCVGEHRLVSAVKDWAKRNATDGLGVYDAAAELKYAPDYMTRIFKKYTGKTTLEYINGVRLQRAKSLLLNSDLSVAQVAYSVGFADEKYFMRLFKREESVTPTQYRTSHVKRHLN